MFGRPRAPSTLTDALCNSALALAIAWGPRSGRPVAVALQERWRGLDPALAEQAAVLAEQVKRTGEGHLVGLAYELDAMPENGRETTTEAVRSRWPWVDDDNLGRMYGHAMYELWHEGFR